MDELVERIKASIANANSDLWFPELTSDLASRAWEGLRRESGLTPDTYGTERVLSQRISAPRDIVESCVKSASGAELRPTIETFSREYAAKFSKKGIRFYSPHETETTVLSCVEEALAIINQVPSLMRTVAMLVRSLHLIRPEDDDHDVSFSEPHIPFSIFVSVPNGRLQNDSLRIAEAIVHEAMHLQLTLIEQIIALVNTNQSKYYSPWRGTYRPIQGILHGVYVFRVIDAFLAELSPVGLSSTYVADRRGVIRNQLLEAQSFQLSPDLTRVGEQLVRRLLSVKL